MTFKEWLEKQTARNDEVGKFAKFALGKDDFPLGGVRRDLERALATHKRPDLASGASAAVEGWSAAVQEERDLEAQAADAQARQARSIAEAKAQEDKDKAEEAAVSRKVPDARLIRKERQEAADARRQAQVQADLDAAAVSPVDQDQPRPKKGRRKAA